MLRTGRCRPAQGHPLGLRGQGQAWGSLCLGPSKWSEDTPRPGLPRLRPGRGMRRPLHSAVPGQCPEQGAGLFRPKARPAAAFSGMEVRSRCPPSSWLQPAASRGPVNCIFQRRLMDNQPASGRQGPKASLFPYPWASSILAQVSSASPSPRPPALSPWFWESRAGPGLGGGSTPCRRSPLIAQVLGGLLFPSCVWGGVCGHQIKAGKSPVFYGATCHRCTGPPDFSMV